MANFNYMLPVATLAGLLIAADARKRRNGEVIEGTTEPEPPPEPPRAVVYLAGRNDRCPCGSGKKYKKCHRPN